MDDQAALIAWRVALAAAAWVNAPQCRGPPPARRGGWRVERLHSPQLDDSDFAELLDDLADMGPTDTLGRGGAGLEAVLRRQARSEL